MMNTQMKSKETAIQNHTLKRPLPVSYAEIKDKNSCPTAANVRLSTLTYIHKRVHRKTHLSCKCRIITVLSEGGKLGCLLKIAKLKRFIDVTLGTVMEERHYETQNWCLSLFLSLSPSHNPNILHFAEQWWVFKSVVRMGEAMCRCTTKKPSLSRCCDHQHPWVRV